MISRRKLSQHLTSADRDDFNCQICSLDSVQNLVSSLDKQRSSKLSSPIPDKSYSLRKLTETKSLPEYSIDTIKGRGPSFGRRSTEYYDKSSKLKPIKPPVDKKCPRCSGTIHHGIAHVCDIRKTMDDMFDDLNSKGVADKMASKCLQPFWNRNSAEIRGGNNKKFTGC